MYANYYAPETLVASGSANQVELKWSSERVGAIQSYQIYRDGTLIDSVVTAVASVDTSFTDANVTEATAYMYHITSRDTLGNVSLASDTVNALTTNGLVAWYPFDGDRNDDSGFNNDLIIDPIFGGSDSYTNDRFGNSNLSLEVILSNTNYLKSNIEEELQIDGDLGVSFWFYSDPFSNEFAMISNTGGGGTSPEDNTLYYIALTSTGAITINHEYAESQFETITTDANLIQANTWYHLGISRNIDSLSYTIYLDGEIVKNGGSDSFSFTNAPVKAVTGNTQPLAIGGGQVNGELDDIRIFNRAISQAEVLSYYQNFNPPQTFSLTGGVGEITLNWSAERLGSTDAYYIYRDGILHDSVVVASSSVDTSFTDSGLSVNNNYQYYITSKDSLGNVSQASDTLSGSIIPLAISEVFPPYSARGDTVTIYGAGISNTPANNTVTIGGLSATVVASTNRTLQIQVPSDSLGILDLIVSNSFGADTLENGFTVNRNAPISFKGRGSTVCLN